MDTIEPSGPYRLRKETIVEADNGPSVWRITWERVDTMERERVSRLMDHEEFAPGSRRQSPDAKPFWILEEIEAIGRPAPDIDD